MLVGEREVGVHAPEHFRGYGCGVGGSRNALNVILVQGWQIRRGRQSPSFSVTLGTVQVAEDFNHLRADWTPHVGDRVWGEMFGQLPELILVKINMYIHINFSKINM